MTGTILVVLSDSHIGSSTAVSPLRFTVHNRSTYEAQVMEANRLQKWLYANWLDFYDYVKSKARKHRIIVAHLGDVIDYNHHGSTQLVQEVGDQVVMAKELLAPYRDMADKFIGILGTAAHAGTGDGLLRLNRAAPTTETGEIVVDDEATGDITITLDETATDGLEVGAYLYDVQLITATAVKTLTSGRLNVTSDVTRAIA